MRFVLVSGFLANIVSYQANIVSCHAKIISYQVFFGFLWRELIQVLFSKTIFDNNKSYWADQHSYWGDLNRYYPDKIYINHIKINIRVAINDISLIEYNIRPSATDSPLKNSEDGHRKPEIRFSNLISD